MARGVTVQKNLDTKELLSVLLAVKKGDFSARMLPDRTGLAGKIADTVNSIIEVNEYITKEFQKMSRMVGKEGKTTQRASIRHLQGSWADCIDSVNSMVADLVQPTNEMARVIGAVAKGDLSQTMALEIDGKPLQGEFLRSAKLVNGMVGQLSSFASEVTRVAREVGTEGKLGGQAEVKGVSGTWKDLTDNVNSMASNLTAQVRNIAEVTTAVANGDLTKKITVDVKGEIQQLKNTINTMVDQLNAFASEVTRVAREVGTEGKLGGQAEVKGVSGTWKDLTDNVNSMAGNLTAQVRNIAEVTTAVANGDLTKKITVDVKGEILELKNTINTMVDQLNAFASEVTRVAREVGTEGKLGGQAEVKGVSGTWKDLTDNVNSMAGNLTAQVRNIAEVTTAVANGDLTKKITVDVKGEILELKNTINTMVDQLNAFASEVTRVAREVGTEGKLGGQAMVRGVGGTWKDLTDNVNSMAGNLTAQVRNIAEVTTAVANGDLTKKITVDVKGEILELKNTINTMVDQLNAFASEVTRVAREVGTEGKLGGQAVVRGVGGTWKDLTDNVNSMASNLTAQVRNIADVTTAVANGDLTKKITVDVKGEILELKNTINTMVDQLNAFASEVTRVAREVGTEGKLGGQAMVRGVGGTWKDLTDNVNSMASNLTAQVRNIAEVTTAVANGDLTKKITVDVKGEILELKNTINTMVDQLNAFASEVTRVAREVGTEGKLGGQAMVRGVGGTWKDLTDNVNSMASNLTAQVRNIAEVTTAVATGDLTKKITVNVKGEILQLKNTINTMVDQLNAFASEVTRVAREVGTEGKLGGQAMVRGVGGTWKDLTDNVNSMASNLTAQVRSIAKVVTAVANGDLKRKLVLEAKGEIAELAETINGMIDTLSVFADQVTTVAREVGIEGKLGGQAHVPGAAGRWRDLTDNVNQLAGNLTTQVRAIADVATAVTQGDLTRSIAVQAAGEVASLKDNINEMIRNLRETTRKNTEQDWLKTNLAKFTRMLQGQRDLLSVGKQILSELSPLVSAQHSVFFVVDNINDEPMIKLLASYAYKERKHISNHFKVGEGLVGQCVLEKERILLTEVPGDYIKVNSGLGEHAPLNIVVLPVVFEGEVKAVIELSSFNRFTDVHLNFMEQLTESIGIVLNTITATMRTEDLLKQSQSLTEELRSQQEELTETNKRLEQQAQNLQQSEERLKDQQRELQKANEALEDRAEQLAQQNTEVEKKNHEVETAKKMLEDKAAQLALTSKFKSEFLANMSHELRTPLNSLLILAKILSENDEANLTTKQLEYIQTIHSSGTDLLDLINDILDLAKIESGTMSVDIDNISFSDIGEFVTRTFKQVAESKHLNFNVELDKALPKAIHTDGKRLQQVLKNLLSNAFKFTEKGGVSLKIKLHQGDDVMFEQDVLNQADTLIAFVVQDTGIGIPPEKHRVIFEAFQQADGTTSRKYGGTGLGLSISRQIAHMLGGEIHLESSPGTGSTFTLYLPTNYTPLNRRSKNIAAKMEMKETAEIPELELVQPNATVAEATDAELATQRPVEFEDEIASLVHIAGSHLPLLFIVEDNLSFANILLESAAKHGFHGVIIDKVNRVLPLARELKPFAILLDVFFPDGNGWVVLDRLKHDLATRHIPVQVISMDEPEQLQRGLRLGAIATMKKPITRTGVDEVMQELQKLQAQTEKKLLLITANQTLQKEIGDLFAQDKITIINETDSAKILSLVQTQNLACIVLELTDTDNNAVMLLKQLQSEEINRRLPIVVLSQKKLSKKKNQEFNKLMQAGHIHLVQSINELFDKAALYLHLPYSSLPPEQQRLLETGRRSDTDLAGKKVLIVDDDIRNIFALTSALERYGIKVLFAENGKTGIELLQQNPDIQLILMDIMMPEMDGYETMENIRKREQFKHLPIVALTAKAMSNDRERCLQAGATEYLTKPVDTEQLLSTLRVWLNK
jgi:HAMP domain-containing protein/signal transduction histidine kinase/CheY-like chemotaxis protein